MPASALRQVRGTTAYGLLLPIGPAEEPVGMVSIPATIEMAEEDRDWHVDQRVNDAR